MNQNEVLSFKSSLEEKKAQLLERLHKIENSKHRQDPLSADWEEQAKELQNDEVIDALDDLEIRELEDVNLAIKRIEQGSFGQCVACGEEIELSRLKAIPFAKKCINCAE